MTLVRPNRRTASAVLAALALALPMRAAATDIVERRLDGVAFEEVALAVEDAIAAEGLTPPTVNAFGEMLARTAADLGHRPDLYRDARIYTFCSARVAATLTAESARNIALCPLSIAIHTQPQAPGQVFMSYRPTGLRSPGGRLADALLQRVARRAAETLLPAATPAPDKAKSTIR